MHSKHAELLYLQRPKMLSGDYFSLMSATSWLSGKQSVLVHLQENHSMHDVERQKRENTPLLARMATYRRMVAGPLGLALKSCILALRAVPLDLYWSYYSGG